MSYGSYAVKLAVLVIMWMLVAHAKAVPSAILSLESPVVTGQVASFDVQLLFVADPTDGITGEEVSFFALDVSGSDALIPQGAFLFSPASPLLDNWNPLPSFPFLFEYETIIDPLASGITHTLGVLNVDLAQVAATPGTALTVALGGIDTIGYDFLDVGSIPDFAFLTPTYDPASQTVTVPIGQGIPEPLTATLSGISLGGLALFALRHRGTNS